MSLRTHDSKQVYLSLAGRSISDGRDESEFVTTEYIKEAVTVTHDASGGMTVSRTNSKAATIKIKILQNSDSHRLLEQLYATQEAAPNGSPISFELRDILGARVEHAARCAFSKRPSSPYGATVVPVEWELVTDELIREVQ